MESDEEKEEEEEEADTAQSKEANDELDDDEFNERMLEDDFYENELMRTKRSAKLSAPKEVEKNLMGFLSTAKTIHELALKIVSDTGDDEWKEAGKRKNKNKKRLTKIENYLKNIVALGDDIDALGTRSDFEYLENEAIDNPWQLNMKEKYTLYNYWLYKYKVEHVRHLETLKSGYNRSANSLTELQMQEDRIIMQEALIIACTTTGSARYSTILKEIGRTY